MADRIKILIQKRTSLKFQSTNLSNTLDKGRIDNVSLKLRMNRVTELYHAFEENNDELVVLDPNDGHQTEFIAMQDRYYSLAAKIENIIHASNMSEASTSRSIDEAQSDNGGSANGCKRRRIKLPEASLPTFDGKYENWLSFKNAFRNMIGSQTDLSDIDKLHYLKSALTGEATNKTRIFTIDGINYSNAWEILERAYEVRRILISRHLTLLLNLLALERETTNGLSKLADDAQQHVASLSALGVTVGPEMIVTILESKLPKSASDRWETTLEREKFPELDTMYEFLYKSAVCASKRERAKETETERSKSEPPTKKRRSLSSNQTFLLNTSRNCIMCKSSRHPLYSCDKFKQLSVQKRIDAIKGAKLCYNCLRSHRGSACKFSSCTICQKRHNTLLHIDNYANAKQSNAAKPEPSQAK